MIRAVDASLVNVQCDKCGERRREAVPNVFLGGSGVDGQLTHDKLKPRVDHIQLEASQGPQDSLKWGRIEGETS